MAESRGFSAFEQQSLRRFATAPFAQGSHGLMQNSAFCRRESRGKSKSFKTENSEKTESLALSFSRSATAPSRREPLFVRVFFFVPQRKQEQKSRFQNRKQQKNKSLALSFSRSATAPSRREPMTVRVFSLCRRENKDKIQGSKLKVRTFFFCGSAVRQPLPSSGRKVSRASVTEGARETKKWQKAAVLHLR